MASLPAPLGPTTSTTRPGPMRSGGDAAELEDALATAIHLVHHRQVARGANAHQVGTLTGRDGAAVVEPRGSRWIERHRANCGGKPEAIDAPRQLESAHQQGRRHV